MKIITLQAATSAAVDITTEAVDLGDSLGYSVQVLITGSNIAGTLRLEGSNDKTTFLTVPSSSVSITSSADKLYNEVSHYRYVRLVFAASSGTGNLSAVMAVKENVVRNA